MSAVYYDDNSMAIYKLILGLFRNQTIMNQSQGLKTIQEVHSSRVQQNWSTASFYDEGVAQSRTRSKAKIAAQFDQIQRDFNQNHGELMLQLQIKRDQIDKRAAQADIQDNLHSQQIRNLQKETNARLKNIHYQDISKKWAQQMQSTVKQIMVDARERQQKKLSKVQNSLRLVQRKLVEDYGELTEEKKDQQRAWENMIDELGEDILQLQSAIDLMGCSSQEKLNELEYEMINMQERGANELKHQIDKRQQEHNYLARLIEGVMAKLIV